MENVKVSVLVPVYGVEKYIEKCAESLFSQTFKSLEFVFVDDCSIDNSILELKNVLTRYPERVSMTKIIQHKKNCGVGAARTTALNVAVGEYLIFVDSDDYIEPDMIELMVAKAESEYADIVICPIINEYINGKVWIYNNIIFENKIDYVNNSFSQPSLCNKLFRRELIKKYDLRIPEGVNYGEDLSFVPQLIYYCNKFSFIEKPTYHYVQYNVNSYTKGFSEEKVNQTLKVINILTEFFSSKEDYKNYNYSLTLLKAIRKAKILRSGEIKSKYIKLFPEINSMLPNLDIDLKTKVILWLAAKNMKTLLQVYVKVLLIKKSQYEN